MLQSKMGKVFVVSFAVGVVSWALAFMLASLGGETIKTALAKVQNQTSSTIIVHEQQPLDLNGIDLVEVSGGSQEIEVLGVDSEKGEIEYSGEATSSVSALDISRSGSRLHITIVKRERPTVNFAFSWHTADNRITLHIPKAFASQLILEARSGDIEVRDLKLSRLDVRTSSGEIETHNCEASSSILHSSSGDMTLDHLRGRLEAEASSGDISLSAYAGEELRLHTTSGEINVTEPKTSSINASATSGNISVKLRDGESWHYNLQASSGEIDNAFGGNPKAVKRLDVRTTSGDIRISR